MKWIEGIKLRHRANKYRNTHDQGGIAFVLREVNAGNTVLDIGSHKGAYLYFMREKAGSSGKVLGFEPQSNLFQYLQKIKSLFHWDNVELNHLALSDSEGSVTLFIPGGKKGKSSSPGASIFKDFGESEFTLQEEVRTQTLDAFCAEKNIRPNFLKVDVEGNELRVFRGGIDTLKTCKPSILVEIEERHVGKEQVLETFEFLHSLGYTGYVLKGMEQLPLTEFRFEIHQNQSDPNNYCNNFIFKT